MKSRFSIYENAREKAARKDPFFTSRERAAMRLYISREALFQYEKEKVIPPCDVVAKMVEAYGDHELRREHICGRCPLLPDYNPNPAALSQSALGVIMAINNQDKLPVLFAKIARDGRITPEEVYAAREVRQWLVDMMNVFQEGITAVDKAFEEGGLLCGVK